MKIKLLSLLLVFLLLTSVLIGGCFGCKEGDKLSTGTYAFSLDDWKFFVKLETDSTGKKEFSYAVSEIPFTGTVERKQGTFFENCYIKLKITINENDYYETISLGTDGNANFNFNINISPLFYKYSSYRPCR